MLPRKQPNLLLKFGNMAVQMAVIIGLAVWGGNALDERSNNETPVWTITLSLAGICAALYLVLKDVMKMNKNNDPE